MSTRAREHAHTQRRLCERFAAPVIGDVACQDLMTWHMQQVVNAAPTATEGARVHGMISALVGAGVECGYLANPRLAKVHWQAGDRPLPPPRVSVAGESGLWVDPAEIPSADDVERLGKALAAGRHGERDQLMPTPRLSIGSNPTPATTCENGPLSAETRPGGTFFRLPRLGRLSPHSRSYAPSLAGKSLAGLWAAGLALQRFL